MTNIITSILMPAIRRERWENVYQSIVKSTNRSFELIIIGPYAPSESLLNRANIKYIKDFGNPVRASQIGSLIAEGKYLFWVSDDGTFQEGALDKLIDNLDERENQSVQDVVVANYKEGGQAQSDEIMKVTRAYPPSPHISSEWYHFNVALMHTQFFHDIGGYDCEFEALPMAYADIAIRCQRAGADVAFINEVIVDCTHMPGTTGDHAPIHYAHLQHDMPRYQMIYNDSSCLERVELDLQNWKESPKIWSRRFKKKEN